MPHPLGVIGLGLNMIGSFLLLWAAPPAAVYTATGFLLSGVVNQAPTEEERLRGQRTYRRQRVTFLVSIWLLVGGFALQLLDMLCG